MASVLIPLPSQGFDPTECAVPWKFLVTTGHRIRFATPDGAVAEADPRMLSGIGLGPFASGLRANATARRAYSELRQSEDFTRPISYAKARREDFDGLILPGGHAPEVRPYLESRELQQLVAEFLGSDKPVGAICHGVVLVARSKDTKTAKSVLYGRKSTALPTWMEMSAWMSTRLWLGNYYRTYPMTVQDEVISCLANPADFIRGPIHLFRDGPKTPDVGFCVRDGNYLSARWPGDAHRFATEFASMLREVRS